MRVLIVGTGLIGTSLALSLRALPEFSASIAGWDPSSAELETAQQLGAFDEVLPSRAAVLEPDAADIYVLACPVLPILDWMRQLAAVLNERQLVTDTGSTKRVIAETAAGLFNKADRARFLPGHPMAGKESGGAALADADLFRNAAWLFTPSDVNESAPEALWRSWIGALGAHVRDLEPAAHDRLCAWVSHLPQMLSTALAAVLEDTFRADPEGMALLHAIGGRALRETTRLGASPYSMWRDVAHTNTEPLADTLLALEQRLAHLRENLRTPELRREFDLANRFRA